MIIDIIVITFILKCFYIKLLLLFIVLIDGHYNDFTTLQVENSLITIAVYKTYRNQLCEQLMSFPFNINLPVCINLYDIHSFFKYNIIQFNV